jgi:hypothetical protein
MLSIIIGNDGGLVLNVHDIRPQIAEDDVQSLTGISRVLGGNRFRLREITAARAHDCQLRQLMVRGRAL